MFSHALLYTWGLQHKQPGSTLACLPQLSWLHTGLATPDTHVGTQAEGLAAQRLAARNAWVNLPNAISAARALSGPGVPRAPGCLHDACVLYVRACATVVRHFLCLL